MHQLKRVFQLTRKFCQYACMIAPFKCFNPLKNFAINNLVFQYPGLKYFIFGANKGMLVGF